MRFLLMLLISINTYAATDSVVEELKKENKLLEEKIETNNRMIQVREQSEYRFKAENFSSSEKTWMITMGVESINWGAEQNGIAPTVGIAHEWGNNIITEATYGRFQNDNFPAGGIQTIVNIYHLNLKYNYQTSFKGLSLQPTVGYVGYEVSSPDAGLLQYDTPEGRDAADDELWKIDGIVARKGFLAGIAIVQKLSKNWSAMLRGDIAKSTTLQLAYTL